MSSTATPATTSATAGSQAATPRRPRVQAWVDPQATRHTL